MLLDEALTHASAANGQKGFANYERLEFLGDRILGLAIAEHLYTTHPKAPEGELARRFNLLVCKEACEDVAKEIGLGQFLKLGESEAHAGGRRKLTILADSCEAVLGAIYLDGGWAAVKMVIVTLWAGRAENIAVCNLKDAKTALQEWVQGGGQTALPRYVKIDVAGPPHAPIFTYEVRLQGLEPARGVGPARRIAEQNAAETVLIREGVWAGPEGEERHEQEKSDH